MTEPEHIPTCGCGHTTQTQAHLDIHMESCIKIRNDTIKYLMLENNKLHNAVLETQNKLNKASRVVTKLKHKRLNPNQPLNFIINLHDTQATTEQAIKEYTSILSMVGNRPINSITNNITTNVTTNREVHVSLSEAEEIAGCTIPISIL